MADLKQKDMERLLKARVLVRAAYSQLCEYYESRWEDDSKHQTHCLSLYYDLDKLLMDNLERTPELENLTLRLAKIKLT